MKSKFFYLFYLLTFLLLAFGVFMNGKNLVLPGWHTIVYKGFWFFVAPTAATSFVIAIIYNFFSYKNWPVKKGMIILHFIFWFLGLISILNLYSTLIFISPLTDEVSIGKVSILMADLSPIFIASSFLVFIFGIIKALYERSSSGESNS